MPCTVARPVACEDLNRGDYVRALWRVAEFAYIKPMSDSVSVARLRLTPCFCEGVMRVVGVCHPFVLARTPDGTHSVVDVRDEELARVDASWGKLAMKRLAPKNDGADETKKKRKKRNRKKRKKRASKS